MRPVQWDYQTLPRDGGEFERYVWSILADLGHAVDVMPAQGEGSRTEAVLTDESAEATTVVRAEYAVRPLGEAAVRAALDARARHDAEEAWVVTNASFSAAGRTLAADDGVRLVEGPELACLVTEANERRAGLWPASGDLDAPDFGGLFVGPDGEAGDETVAAAADGRGAVGCATTVIPPAAAGVTSAVPQAGSTRVMGEGATGAPSAGAGQVPTEPAYAVSPTQPMPPATSRQPAAAPGASAGSDSSREARRGSGCAPGCAGGCLTSLVGLAFAVALLAGAAYALYHYYASGALDNILASLNLDSVVQRAVEKARELLAGYLGEGE